MQRPVDAVLLQPGVDGLRQAGFDEAHGFGPLDVEEFLQFRRGVMLHHRVGRKIFQHLVAAGGGDVIGDEDEMQAAAVRAQRVAADEQRAGLQHEREKLLDGLDGKFAGFQGVPHFRRDERCESQI